MFSNYYETVVKKSKGVEISVKKKKKKKKQEKIDK